MESTDTFSREKAVLLIIKSGGTHSCHRALKRNRRSNIHYLVLTQDHARHSDLVPRRQRYVNEILSRFMRDKTISSAQCGDIDFSGYLLLTTQKV
jgi:hypothetical protein